MKINEKLLTDIYYQYYLTDMFRCRTKRAKHYFSEQQLLEIILMLMQYYVQLS